MPSDNIFSPLPGAGTTSPEGFQFGPLEPDAPVFVHLDGDVVVTPVVATWPPYCVRCGSSVPAPDFVLNTSWTPRWVILVFVFIRWLGILLYFVNRKKLSLNIGLCEEHRVRRSRLMWAGGAGMVVSVIAGCASFDENGLGLAVFFGSLGLASLVVLVVGAQLVTVKNVDKDVARVKVKPQFLEAMRRATEGGY